MDGAGRVSVVRSSDPQDVGLTLEGSDSFARTLAKRGDSKLGCLACSMGLERPFAKRVKLPCINVVFKLPVPGCSIERSKPLPQSRQLVG